MDTLKTTSQINIHAYVVQQYITSWSSCDDKLCSKHQEQLLLFVLAGDLKEQSLSINMFNFVRAPAWQNVIVDNLSWFKTDLLLTRKPFLKI